MYYPYLRGKQFELIMLREQAALMSLSGEIHPVIEPVRENFTMLERTLEALEAADVKYTLIVNSQVASTNVKQEDILSFIEQMTSNRCLTLGYILNSTTSLTVLDQFVSNNSDTLIALVHYGFSNSKELASLVQNHNNIKSHIFVDRFAGKRYQRKFKSNGVKRILLRDGFKTQKRNSDYPPSEHFSELHLTYEDEGMDGFGDFLIVGDEYSETGGPAHAVAIHLTYIDDDEDMCIYHFISDRTDSPVDPGGKFLEALEKLIAELRKKDTLLFSS